MSKVRITKVFSFEMAHALDYHAGKCRNIHGHSYYLEVTLLGTPNVNNESDKGMVIDFSELKDVVNKEIVDQLDHALVLHKHSKYVSVGENDHKLVLVDYQPTCENMVIDFAQRIKALLPSKVDIYKLKLTETATSYAEWYASDNI
jgi:6-pyruvoyltetrahydropterin/6-carboxytetrahydropterin synthase